VAESNRKAGVSQEVRMTTNLANAMSSVTDDVRDRQLAHFRKADPEYGATIASKLVEIAQGAK
jgi:catalase